MEKGKLIQRQISTLESIDAELRRSLSDAKMVRVIRERVSQIQQHIQIYGESISNLNNYFKGSYELSAQLNSISNEVKMLSLNGAVEADRASESGAGLHEIAKNIGVVSERLSKLTMSFSDTSDGAYSGVKAARESLEILSASVASLAEIIVNVESQKKVIEDAIGNIQEVITRLRSV